MSSVYDNGLPLGATDWIADGTLTSLIQTRHTASELGQPTTPAIDNLVLEVAGGAGSDLDLAAQMDDGLLLTCLWYIREVDPQTMLLTGLTRDGVYRVEGGEITGAVNNFRFNESPVDLLQRFSHAGATVPSFSREWGEDFFSRTATPALRVPDFNMSSVSPGPLTAAGGSAPLGGRPGGEQAAEDERPAPTRASTPATTGAPRRAATSRSSGPPARLGAQPPPLGSRPRARWTARRAPSGRARTPSRGPATTRPGDHRASMPTRTVATQ